MSNRKKKSNNKGHNKKVLGDAYTCAEVSRALRMTPRCILYWDEKQLIHPTLGGRKTNNKRLYTFREIIQIKIIKSLRNKGVSLRTIKDALDNLQEDNVISERTFIKLKMATDGKSIYINEKGNVWNPVNKQMLLDLFSFEEFVEETSKIIKIDGDPSQLKVKDVFFKPKKPKRRTG